ncbi:MAG: F0F1 ATP synthase subunit delta [Hyphomicrobiales bacterium]|nr:MAG: F0F1 ATP synthase subunit delta [Hyphomicrobiales bacterium]
MTESNSLVSPVAQRYAAALYELAAEAKAVESVEADLERFAALLAESEDLRRLVRSPVFQASEQAKALGAIMEKAGIGGLAANFVQLAARNRRLFAVPDMINGFKKLAADARGEVAADVTSAETLSDAEVKDLAEALKSVTGKTVKLNQTVDASLIGGLVVRLGSRMIDTSLKTKLNSLKIALKEVG